MLSLMREQKILDGKSTPTPEVPKLSAAQRKKANRAKKEAAKAEEERLAALARDGDGKGGGKGKAKAKPAAKPLSAEELAIKRKTLPCVFHKSQWNPEGVCKDGDNCVYAHDREHKTQADYDRAKESIGKYRRERSLSRERGVSDVVDQTQSPTTATGGSRTRRCSPPAKEKA